MNSILGTVDTGFGDENRLIKDCKKFKTHLFKENYFSEFKGETEKALARYNLDVYSKDEVTKLISGVISDGTQTFVTKEQVEEMIADIDYVAGGSKSYEADYEIPNTIFPS